MMNMLYVDEKMMMMMNDDEIDYYLHLNLNPRKYFVHEHEVFVLVPAQKEVQHVQVQLQDKQGLQPSKCNKMVKSIQHCRFPGGPPPQY